MDGASKSRPKPLYRNRILRVGVDKKVTDNLAIAQLDDDFAQDVAAELQHCSDGSAMDDPRSLPKAAPGRFQVVNLVKEPPAMLGC